MSGYPKPRSGKRIAFAMGIVSTLAAQQALKLIGPAPIPPEEYYRAYDALQQAARQHPIFERLSVIQQNRREGRLTGKVEVRNGIEYHEIKGGGFLAGNPVNATHDAREYAEDIFRTAKAYLKADNSPITVEYDPKNSNALSLGLKMTGPMNLAGLLGDLRSKSGQRQEIKEQLLNAILDHPGISKMKPEEVRLHDTVTGLAISSSQDISSHSEAVIKAAYSTMTKKDLKRWEITTTGPRDGKFLMFSSTERKPRERSAYERPQGLKPQPLPAPVRTGSYTPPNRRARDFARHR